MSEAREVGDRQSEAIINNDLDAALECYSEDAVIVTPEGRFKGKDQIREFMRRWFEPFQTLKADFTSKFEAGSKAMDEWVMKLRNTGEIKLPDGTSMPATNKEISMHGVDVYEVHDGRITEHHFYYDTEEIPKQLGMMPA